MDTPLVSVEMITYNHAPYIAQAIEGVLQQKTDFPFELVIGEDCSTDGTREIVFEYQRKRPDIIRVATSDRNVGSCKNGCRASRACRGTYLAYCEGDDYWHRPDKLQIQVEYMRSHPECVMVYSDRDNHDVSNDRWERSVNRTQKIVPPENPDISEILFEPAWTIATCTVLVRKNLLDQLVDADPVLYQSGRFMMGDTPRWAELATLGRIGYIDESLAIRNCLAESASHSRDPKKLLRFTKSGYELILYMIEKHGLSEQQRTRYQYRWRRCALKLAFLEGNAILAEEVRKQAGGLSLMERILYWGARSGPAHAVLMPTSRLLGRVRRLVRG